MFCSANVGAAEEPLVLAQFFDNQGVAYAGLISLADPAVANTLCKISVARNARFISRTEFGYLTNSSSNDPIHGTTQIARHVLSNVPPVVVVSVQGDVMDFAWSPDGSTLAYLLYTEDANGAANQLWLKVGSAAPRALTPPIPLFGRGGSADDQILVRFSHDGKYLLMVDTWVSGAAPASPDQAVLQVHSVPDGGLVWVPPSALAASGNKLGSFVTMAAWSHQSDRVYYRDPAGVHSWDPTGTVSTIGAGLVWYSPSVSPDDRLVAYTVDAGGQPHIEVRDLVTSSVRVIPGTLGQPILLSDNEFIESHSGVYILNLLTKVETPLLVVPTFVNPQAIDTWPH